MSPARRERTGQRVGGDPTTPRTWIAVGDSFAAGTGDHHLHRGWINRAACLAIGDGFIDNAVNHAIPGVDLDTVIGTQLPLVQPCHLISATACANDLLRPRCDIDQLINRIGVLFDAVLGLADVVLTCTCPDFSVPRQRRLPRLAARIDAVNACVRDRAAAGPRFLVVDANRILGDPGLWSDDRVHPNPRGHQLLANSAATLLREHADHR